VTPAGMSGDGPDEADDELTPRELTGRELLAALAARDLEQIQARRAARRAEWDEAVSRLGVPPCMIGPCASCGLLIIRYGPPELFRPEHDERGRLVGGSYPAPGLSRTTGTLCPACAAALDAERERQRAARRPPAAPGRAA